MSQAVVLTGIQRLWCPYGHLETSKRLSQSSLVLDLWTWGIPVSSLGAKDVVQQVLTLAQGCLERLDHAQPASMSESSPLVSREDNENLNHFHLEIVTGQWFLSYVLLIGTGWLQGLLARLFLATSRHCCTFKITFLFPIPNQRP